MSMWGRFIVGDPVLVSAEIIAVKNYLPGNGRRRDLVRSPFSSPVRAVVVGGTHLFSGSIDWIGPEDGSAFIQAGNALPVWLVRVGFLNKPMYVQDEDASPLCGDPDFPFGHLPTIAKIPISASWNGEVVET